MMWRLVPLAALTFLASLAPAQIRVIPKPGKSPLVTFRIVFTTGAASDPAGKPGVAYLTARMLADGGTADLTYRQITDALFPMAASVNAQVDKEMSTFSGATHVENLQSYYELLRAMLLSPGWRPEDFQRVKDDAINAIRVGLRGNDEELGKEVLYHDIFEGTPYGPYNGGTVNSLESITLDDVKAFYRSQYSQTHLIIGIAGGYPPTFVDAMKKDFRRLPEGAGFQPRQQAPKPIESTRVVIVEKNTRSVAFSLGFPIAITRSNPDFTALLLAASYLGEHRMASGVLFQQMRDKRGLNYGDYAYIEYFPRGMYRMEPEPNLARRFQIFQLWMRPLEPPTARFALRLALYELDKLIKEGLSQEAFEGTRDFLRKYVNILTRTPGAALGYAIDSLFYNRADYVQALKADLEKLTRDQVNAAIRRHLRTGRMVIVAVSRDGEALKRQLAGADPSPLTYNSPKPAALLEEDKTVEQWPLNLSTARITIVPADKVFQ
jgi:zinc protease